MHWRRKGKEEKEIGEEKKYKKGKMERKNSGERRMVDAQEEREVRRG